MLFEELFCFFLPKHILKLFKLKKISLLGYLDINETKSNKNFRIFCMSFIFKFHCSYQKTKKTGLFLTAYRYFNRIVKNYKRFKT